jgi:hypothetical protein
MRLIWTTGLVFALVYCSSVGALAGAGESVTGSRAAELVVTSTLDGKKSLPQRVRWLAFPKVPGGGAAHPSEVDFFIDGKLRCVEHAAPWNYGSDDLDGHLGWLVTSWLTPGVHRFTVRARLANGKTASETVSARVSAAPPPPNVLARGRWERTVTTAEIQKYGGELPAGKWHLVFDRLGVWELDPRGSGIGEHVVIKGNTIRVDAALWMFPVVKGGHFPASRRYGHTDIGAGWREDGPPAVYNWSVTNDHLTLTPKSEISGSRRALWFGTWTRRP